MFPPPFQYHTPTTIEQALDLLERFKDDAKLLAGGHSLIPAMKLRLTQPQHLIDLRRIAALRGIETERDRLVLGAMTTHWEIESTPLVRSLHPVVAETAAVIADPQVRNRGTIGGSLVHADPSADYPAAILALEAEFVCAGRDALRTVRAEDWFQGLMTTALSEDEILVEIRIPVLPRGAGASYLKLPHLASRYAVVGVAAVVIIGEDGRCKEARVGITGVGTMPTRAAGVEMLLRGTKLDDEVVAAASEKACVGIDVQPALQLRGEHKQHLCRVFTRRALARAAARARVGIAGTNTAT
jgi:carbon-monoxide dehydrogenase medium subunit